jgi:hypothetical protein
VDCTDSRASAVSWPRIACAELPNSVDALAPSISVHDSLAATMDCVTGSITKIAPCGCTAPANRLGSFPQTLMSGSVWEDAFIMVCR